MGSSVLRASLFGKYIRIDVIDYLRAATSSAKEEEDGRLRGTRLYNRPWHASPVFMDMLCGFLIYGDCVGLFWVFVK